MAQVEQRRNTDIERRCKSRNWCFTLNNYDSSDIETVTDSKYQYIFQEETGKEGTPHLQGMISNVNAVSFNSMKKLLPAAHWEVCRNKIASIQYCQKGESRTGSIYCNVDSWLGDTSGTGTDTPLDVSKERLEIFDLLWDMRFNDIESYNIYKNSNDKYKNVSDEIEELILLKL